MIATEVLTGVIILLISSVLYNKFKRYESKAKCREDRDAIERYLIQSDIEYSDSKPNMWIYVPTDYNARCWQSWGSRSSDAVNQPYLGLSVGSIVSKCSAEFNICSVTDNSIVDLLPRWRIDLSKIGDPVRSKLRDIAMAKIIYKYGGLIVPCGFVCNRSLRPAYDSAMLTTGMIVFPTASKCADVKREVMLSNKFMGCRKGSPVMSDFINHLQEVASADFTEASVFEGRNNKWLEAAKEGGQLTGMCASSCGVVDVKGKLVTLDRLMDEEFIPFSSVSYGTIIPREALLRRKKYGWLPVISAIDAVQVDNMAGKTLLLGLSQ
tara:strand:- start:9768 stop:10736 length:969 start_codon:yes stop_codon:yes gene_type:complete